MVTEFLFFLLRKIWYLWGLFLSGIRYFDSCWTNYNTKAPVWRYADTSWQHQHPLHICIAAKMSKSFTFPLRSFLFIYFFSFLKGNPRVLLLPHHFLFVLKNLGYGFFYCNTSGNLQRNKSLDILVLLLHQSLPATVRNLNIP